MKEWMELVDYNITEGSKYGWSCYGPNSYTLDSWNGIHGDGGYSFSIIFSTKSQKVYEVSVCDYTNNRAYRMIAENKQEKHRAEALERDVALNEAWDEVDYIDLEVVEDFMEKARAIRAGKDYADTVMVPLDIPEDLLMLAFKAAHKADMTFNDWMNWMLRDFIDTLNRDAIPRTDNHEWARESSAWPFPTNIDENKDEDKTGI